MSLPPSVRVLTPSFSLNETSNIVTLSIDDFKKLIGFALESIEVDEDWYIARYSDVREASQSRGSKSYATEHYRSHGFLEGRLPRDPVVDEEWYRKCYPDVDEAIRLGREVSAKSHFLDQGYHEGRKPVPDEPSAALSASRATRNGRAATARVPTRAPLARVGARLW
jgi:hypothetical protein